MSACVPSLASNDTVGKSNQLVGKTNSNQHRNQGEAMSERDHYPTGVPCWVDSSQRDPRAAVDFYRGLFGWEFAGPGPMSDGGEYFVARLHGHDVAGISSMPAQSGPPAPVWNTYISVDSA